MALKSAILEAGEGRKVLANAPIAPNILCVHQVLQAVKGARAILVMACEEKVVHGAVAGW